MCNSYKYACLMLACISWGKVDGFSSQGLELFFWKDRFLNFGDHLSQILIERILGQPISIYQKGAPITQPRLFGIGSIISFARTGDIIWGSGVKGKLPNFSIYKFKNLDVRAVRGPLTRDFLHYYFNIEAPEVYGDPALLLPYFLPEFQRSEHPTYDYLIIPHYSEQTLFPKEKFKNVAYPTDPWYEVVAKILDSKFVISSSLHGIIVAEAFGIPARFLRITDHEPMFKYEDYYLGTNRPYFKIAYSVKQALKLGGETPGSCDLKKLYEAFPFEFWPHIQFINPFITQEHA